MKKKLLLVVLIGILVVFITNYYSKHYKSIDNTEGIAVFIEDNSGNYVKYDSDTLPDNNYSFNAEKSVCENGGVVSWSNDLASVVFEGNKMDKCYIYFDKNSE